MPGFGEKPPGAEGESEELRESRKEIKREGLRADMFFHLSPIFRDKRGTPDLSKAVQDKLDRMGLKESQYTFTVPEDGNSLRFTFHSRELGDVTVEFGEEQP